jgi:hypothetical protein
MQATVSFGIHVTGRVIWYVKRVCGSMNKLGYIISPKDDHGDHVFLAPLHILVLSIQISTRVWR